MENQRDDNLKRLVKNSSSNTNTTNSFFCNEEVKKCKNPVFKIQCESAITSTGLSNQQFYLKIKVSRQQWYYWSWGIIPFPSWLKIKLCDVFGKPFRDLFLQEMLEK